MAFEPLTLQQDTMKILRKIKARDKLKSFNEVIEQLLTKGGEV